MAKCFSETGSILRREAPAKPWQVVANKEALHTGDVLMAGSDATLESDNGAVRLLLLGDAGGASPLPLIETAVVLHASADVDLDFALLRGRVDLINQNGKGEARVRVRGREGAAEIRLLEPGTQVALVMYGRWLPGVPFRKDAQATEQGPAQVFTVLVLRGAIDIRTPKHQFAMRAPPGPAVLEGDGVSAADASPRRLEQLPDWAVEKAASEDAKRIRAGLARFRELVKRKSIPEAVGQLLQSKTPEDRRIAVALLGATDDLAGLANVLANAPRPDIWENGVVVIRHWIGREPSQDQKLYEALIDQKKLTPAEAETVMQLLHAFSDDALAQPETYEALLDLLESDQLAIRGLAHWHLYRLVPAGRKIGFDPVAVAEKRTQDVAAWRQLIPTGKLPPSK
jgi:hypothetical protein